MGHPSVFPTGATIYAQDKCWNGYTVFQAKDVGATLIDMNHNMVYRSYRVPYEWIPQLDRPEEKEIPRLDSSKFRVPGAGRGVEPERIIQIKEGGFVFESQTCVIEEDRKEN